LTSHKDKNGYVEEVSVHTAGDAGREEIRQGSDLIGLHAQPFLFISFSTY